jgi:hypothetical protein
MPPGAVAVMTNYGSGSLIFYQRLEEIFIEKVMVASIHVRKYSSQRRHFKIRILGARAERNI